jgi:transposase
MLNYSLSWITRIIRNSRFFLVWRQSKKQLNEEFSFSFYVSGQVLLNANAYFELNIILLFGVSSSFSTFKRFLHISYSNSFFGVQIKSSGFRYFRYYKPPQSFQSKYFCKQNVTIDKLSKFFGKL